ncbi:MAG: choice-of-anchor I family protein [Ramlibacter sp.]|uniref:choice-of-anchor I family protein n=1 Tax=Ramlibacter sp. TaxID=1917967 RepID=UPI002628AA69|nr:choice-of-anchor I family protein [Ramlibacter sp.]MDH4376294.1 choice-of-anchor I family protein [Ramlibacter sp.]
MVTAVLAACGGGDGQDASDQVISISVEGRSASQGFNVSAAEVVAHDATAGRIFTVNAQSGKVDVFAAASAAQFASISAPQQSIDLAAMLVANSVVGSTGLVGAANSVSVYGNVVAVAVEANPKTDNGWVVFLNATTLAFQRAVQVGALPDMLVFTPDGTKVLVANEGEPNVGYTIDPEGSVSVIRLSDYSVSTIGFSDFNVGGSRNSELPSAKMLIAGVGVGGGATVAKDLEPEYIAIRPDGLEAYVTLQEANAIAVLNLVNNTVTKIIGMGFKDHTIPGNEFDASQQDGVNLKTWPVLGAYMPDSIAAYTVAGRTFLVTANEGDSREDWLNGLTDQASCEAAGYYFSSSKCRDELALRDVATTAPAAFIAKLTLSTELDALKTDTTLGRLKFSYHATNAKNTGSTFTRLYAYGARSFSIWDAQTGERVYDSGSDFERHTANRYGSLFNQDHNGSLTGDKRSNSKGPEPEGLAIGEINGRTYAFVGLERMGGVMVYDITNPNAPTFQQYLNNRDVTVAPNAAAVTAGSDLGPEALAFVGGSKSPDGVPRLIVGNEVSGTTTVYKINVQTVR